MTKEKYTTKSGATQFRPVLSQASYLAIAGDGTGFCLACGSEASEVEPDAKRYTCEACGQPKVFGLEELLMMGLLRIKGGK
jgi:hypothetical protein